jgi:hypothetical protein
VPPTKDFISPGRMRSKRAGSKPFFQPVVDKDRVIGFIAEIDALRQPKRNQHDRNDEEADIKPSLHEKTLIPLSIDLRRDDATAQLCSIWLPAPERKIEINGSDFDPF